MAMLTTLRRFASGSIAVSQVESSSAWGAPLNGAIGTPLTPFTIRHWSSTPFSGSRICGGDSTYVAGSAGQNRSMITPCGMYMNARRTGGLPVRPSAQPIVSSRGSASAAPAPRSRVRRSIRGSFRIRRPFQIPGPAMGKRIAGHDFDHERLHPVAVLRHRRRHPVHDNLIIPVQAAAERVGEESRRQVARDVVPAGGEDPLELLRRAEPYIARKLAGRVDRAAGIVAVAPPSDRVEVLEPETDRVEHRVAARAGRVGPME